MALLTFTPDAILAHSGFGTAPTTSNLSAQDANWAVASSNTSNTDARVSFSHPSATVAGSQVSPGANLQTFSVEVRKNGGTGTPSITIAVFENGTQRSVSSALSVTNTTSMVLQFTWDASVLADPTGAGVECRVLTSSAGGSPTTRASVDFGYVEWIADYTIDTTPPTITSSATQSVVENTAFSMTLTASEAVTWSKVGGADQALFTLTGPTLSMTAKDFEAPIDSDGNNTYVVTVRATDAANLTADQTVTVTVTDEVVTITSSSTVVVAENTALAHSLTVASGTPTWSLVGGADQARFEIIGSTLRWLSNGTKNFEIPDDSDQNNTYVVTVRATSVSGETANQAITVTVTDRPYPIVTNPIYFTANHNAATTLSLTVQSGSPTFSIVGGSDSGQFQLVGATLVFQPQSFYAPSDSNKDNLYTVMVRYTIDGEFTNVTINAKVLPPAQPMRAIWGRRFVAVGETTAREHFSYATSAGGAFALPTNRKVGDMAIMTVLSANKTITTPTGWTLLHATPGLGTVDSATDAVKMHVFFRRIDGTEAANVTVSITGGSAATSSIGIKCYVGIRDGFESVGSVQHPSPVTLHPLAPVSATVPNSLTILFKGRPRTTGIGFVTFPEPTNYLPEQTNSFEGSQQTLSAGNITHYQLAEATGSIGFTDWQTDVATISETVTVVAKPGVAPVITSALSGSVAENSPFDLLLTSDIPASWAVSGADAAHFNTVVISGLSRLKFHPQNFEKPADANSDNVYTVQLHATANGQTTTQTFNLTVTNVKTFGDTRLRLRRAASLNTSATSSDSATYAGVTSTNNHLEIELNSNRRINDIGVISVTTRNVPISPPAGWQLLHERGFGTPGDATARRLTIFWRRLDGTEAPRVFIPTPEGKNVSATCLFLEDAATTGNPFTLISSADVTTPSTTVTLPMGRPQIDGNGILSLAAANPNSSYQSIVKFPSGYQSLDYAGLASGGLGFFAVNAGGEIGEGIYSVSSATEYTLATFRVSGTGYNIDPSDTTPGAIYTPSYIKYTEGMDLKLFISGSETMEYSIVGGSDMNLFDVVSNRLTLAAKSFSTPVDANGDNVYEVIYRGRDLGGNTTDKAFFVEIIPTTVGQAPAHAYDFTSLNVGDPIETLPDWIKIAATSTASLEYIGNNALGFSAPSRTNADYLHDVYIPSENFIEITPNAASDTPFYYLTAMSDATANVYYYAYLSFSSGEATFSVYRQGGAYSTSIGPGLSLSGTLNKPIGLRAYDTGTATVVELYMDRKLKASWADDSIDRLTGGRVGFYAWEDVPANDMTITNIRSNYVPPAGETAVRRGPPRSTHWL
jgi:hypothetical protein